MTENSKYPFKSEDVVSDNKLELAQALALQVSENLTAAINSRGSATLVVSGGSTPLPFFKALSVIDLKWDKVTLLLADERWVAHDHPDSNEKFVKQHLMINKASQASFTGLKTSADNPEDGWAEVEATISSVARPFDVLILGMGGDGHTASLFPGVEGLEQAIAKDCGRLTWPMNPETVDQPRMTLTLDCLLDTRNLYLHITGDDKRSVFEKAATADAAIYPIAAVIKTAADRLRVFWSP